MMSIPADDDLADDDLEITAKLPILSAADFVDAPHGVDDATVEYPTQLGAAAALADTEIKLTQLHARHDSLQTQHADLLIHGQAVSRDRDRLAEESLLWMASRKQLQDQLEQQRQQGEALQTELLTAQQQFEKQHASAAALARSMAQALLEKDELQRTLVAREQRIAALESRFSDTSLQLASAIANGESLVQSVVTHQQEISERARQAAELQRDLTLSSERIEDLVSQVESEKMHWRSAEEDKERLCQTVAAEREMLENTRRELSERQAEIGALMQREAMLLDSVMLLREELGQVQLQLQERDQTAVVQAERIADLCAAVQHLQDELHQHVEAMLAIRRDIHQVALQTRKNEGGTLLRTLTRDDPEGVVHLLNKSSISIGRGPECDIRLRSSSVSRYHAVLRISHDAVIFEDMNSTNGCYVNGRRITRQLLKDGDMLKVGAVPLRFGSRATQD